MKTAEDEAFEDIERRQGGGFPAKKAMAADKLLEPVECLDCGSNNVGIPATYDSLVDSVKSQPAQEPVAWVGLTDEERESIAQDYSLTGFGYQSPFKAIEAKLKEKNA